VVPPIFIGASEYGRDEGPSAASRIPLTDPLGNGGKVLRVTDELYTVVDSVDTPVDDGMTGGGELSGDEGGSDGELVLPCPVGFVVIVGEVPGGA